MTKTKEISVFSEQLAKISEVDMNRLFHSSSSGLAGVEDTRTLPFPYEIAIVQKLTGDALFSNAEDNDRSVKGKMYIKPKKTKNAEGKYVYEKLLMKDDFKSEMSLTLLKVEFGVEIWRKEKKEGLDFPITVTYARSKEMIHPNEREEWTAAHEGYSYTNQIRLIMTPYTALEISEMGKTGKNPFVTITLSGGDGWNTWNVINKKMTEQKKSIGIKGKLSDVLSSMFVLKLSTLKTKQGANEYFIFDVDVSLNDIQEALKLEELVNMLDTDFTFFFNTKDQDPTLRRIEVTDREVIDSTFDDDTVDDMQTAKEMKSEIKTDDPDTALEEDLPF